MAQEDSPFLCPALGKSRPVASSFRVHGTVAFTVQIAAFNIAHIAVPSAQIQQKAVFSLKDVAAGLRALVIDAFPEHALFLLLLLLLG